MGCAFLFSAPTGSRDVYAYALQGLLYTHGLDPYAVGPAALDSPWLPAMSQFWQNSPTPYGPLAVLLSGAAAALSGGQLVVALIWLRLSALLGVILTAVYLPRLARTCGADPIAAGWLGAASPLVFVHLLSAAQHDALTLGLLIAGLHLATRHRGWQSGIALGLAAAVKATAIIVVPFAVLLTVAALTGRWRASRGAAIVTVPAVAIFLAVSVAGDLGLGWLRAAPGPHSVIHWMSVPTAFRLVLGGMAGVAGIPHALVTIVPAVRIAAWYVVLPIVLTALWWTVRRTPNPRAIVTATGYALAAAVLLSPLVYPWYLVAPIAVLAAVTDMHRVRMALAAVVAFGVFVVLPDGINLAHVTKWPGAVVEIAALIALAIWWIGKSRRAGASRSIPDPRAAKDGRQSSPPGHRPQIPLASTGVITETAASSRPPPLRS